MKELINRVLFGQSAKGSGAIALGLILSIALGCNCNKTFDLANLSNNINSRNASDNYSTDSDVSVPSEAVTEQLVKQTMSEFVDAVDTGDFTTIYNNSSSDFQSTYTVDEMNSAFKAYTDNRKRVVPILKKIQGLGAEFDSPPSIRTEKGLPVLMAKGRFKTKPFQTRFDYEYVRRDGEWKLLKLVINIP